MQVLYNSKTDLLYLRLDDRPQAVINQRVTDDIVLDIGADEKIIGIEISDASTHLTLKQVLPVEYEVLPEVA